MTSFEYWSRMVPEGQFMCQVCFYSRPVAEAWRDENQLQWDICEACKLHEGMTAVQLRHKEEIAELIDEVKDLEAEHAQAKIQIEFYKGAYAGVKLGLDNALVENVLLRREVKYRKSMITGMRRSNELNETDIAALQAENAALRERLKPRPAPMYVSPTDDRDPDCVELWPECHNGGYNPSCCRFPKSCSC
jgi:hypothetical protein